MTLHTLYKNTFEGALIQKKGVKSKHYGMSTMCVSLQRFYGALADYVKLSIEIYWCPDFVNFIHAAILQRSYGTLTMSIYRDFMVPRLCQFTEILQRFYGALTMSIYRDFMLPPQCQFTEILHDKTNPVKSL